MHTVFPAGNRRVFHVAHLDRQHDIIQTFDNVEEASYFCNRLNGGFSSEMAILTMALKPLLERILEDAPNVTR